MYEEERLQKIYQYVQQNNRASVHHLCSLFHVSESTIRRDLTELEKRQLLKRTHGGAICMDSVGMEQTYNEKIDRFQEEKRQIAAKAASLIQNGDSVLIDSGTTTLYLAGYLSAFQSLTVVTNSIYLMQQLSNQPGLTLISLGGTLRSNTMALVGPMTEQNLLQIRVDKAFMATNGIDGEMGLTTPNLLEAATKRKMMQVAEQVYVLADHSKIGRVSFAKFGSLAEVDGCVTSSLVPQERCRELRDRQVHLYFAEAPRQTEPQTEGGC
ncbi:DeoR/GlpR family DNA-binding transcription regulator [Caproicibacterium sp. XB1]|uniref:DeoR/GlpR family DNA-binding transcription regulator n=1 Tax=Caproicibacterium sp. XB1 TaxID=3396405 RepID=UPI0039B6F51A